MSGATQLGGLTLTWNRLYIIVFAILVLAALMAALRFTPLGLADARGDAEPADGGGDGHSYTVDRRADLRSWLRRRGHGGRGAEPDRQRLAQSGQSYIIDSFMVVVFGGVGNLWGTTWVR